MEGEGGSGVGSDSEKNNGVDRFVEKKLPSIHLNFYTPLNKHEKLPCTCFIYIYVYVNDKPASQINRPSYHQSLSPPGLVVNLCCASPCNDSFELLDCEGPASAFKESKGSSKKEKPQKLLTTHSKREKRELVE